MRLPLALLVCLFVTACSDGEDAAAPPPESLPVDENPPVPPAEADEAAPPAVLAEDVLVISHASQLAKIADPGRVRVLDLALSEVDATERPDTSLGPGLEGTDRCEGLDLIRAAERMPSVVELRISGCQSAVHTGLSAFAPSLQRLELVDLVLDEVTLGRLRQLTRLRELTLTRVKPGTEAESHLGRSLELDALTLRELDKDSTIGDLLGDFPTLRRARLEGAWAGHRAMLSLSKAKRLEELVVIDTNVGNFALNQIKGFSALRKVDWAGPTFNDYSPLYLRDLPVTEFRCACPNLGDGGLRHLKYSKGLRSLELPRSRISSEGLAALTELVEIEQLSILHRDVDGVGFAALAELPKLRRLTLGKTELTDPRAESLSGLSHVEDLVLSFSNFDDRGAEELSQLTQLRALDLGGTAISDAGLRHLAKLERLTVLKLHHTRITNRGLAHLAGLTQLEVLELDHTDVLDDGVAHLAGLTNLRELRLDSTLITDRALASLRGLEKLERLNLASTVVTDEGAQQLSELPALSAVNLEDTRVDDAQPR
jgi:hypothetical protein